jgi:response regulator RpfG family c-di-GMP phosphodiesterase
MVTGFADYTDTLRAINTGGISYYLSKPWKDEEMKQLVRDCILRFNLQAENKYLLGELKRKNEHLQELLEGTVGQTSRILSDLVGYVNPHASSQVGRVRKLGEAILTTLPELPSEERWEIQRALDLFNLGIAVLPAWMQVSINKEGLGSLSRFPIAKNHHLLAAGLLKDIPRFCGVSKIVLMQLKNFDGTGEPSDIVCRGKDIPLGARLLHILLDLDRLSTERFRGREVLEFMRKRPATYDVDLIARMLGDYATQPSTARIQDVTVDQLCPGMIPLSDILTKGGVLLLSSQTVLTETAICTIKQWHKNDPVVSPLEVQINS